MNKVNIKLVIIVLTGILFSFQKVISQTWEVPDDKKQKVSSFKFDLETQKKGEAIFQRNCVSCHGTPGKANFVKLVPPPGDPATDKFQKQVDGALFYKMTTGRGAMPSFKDVLTEQERWQIISYFRSFNKGYIQPQVVAAVSGVFAGTDFKFKLDFFSEKHLIKVTAIGTKNNETELVSGLALSLFAKRYFGKLQIDEPKTTNASGEAFFEYKNKINGDSAGNVSFTIKVNAEGLDGITSDTTIKAGIPVIAKSLIDTRAMWTVRSKAPIWLILAYSLIVIAVWSILIYIILQIAKIRKLGSIK